MDYVTHSLGASSRTVLAVLVAISLSSCGKGDSDKTAAPAATTARQAATPAVDKAAAKKPSEETVKAVESKSKSGKKAGGKTKLEADPLGGSGEEAAAPAPAIEEKDDEAESDEAPADEEGPVAISKPGDDEELLAKGDEEAIAQGEAAEPPAPAASSASGNIKVVHRRPEDSELLPIYEDIKEVGVFEELAKGLAETIKLPRELGLIFEQCGEVNAAYDLDSKTIHMCYELLADFEEIFGQHYKDDDLAAAVVGSTLFTLFHELGHALVDLLGIPITGKEEDAVDQLATWILIGEDDDEGEAMAIDGAEAFLLGTEEEKFRDLAFWDSHSLDRQRFFNILCWVYGHAPDKYADMIKDGDLPEERADQCPDEWRQLSSSWSRLLEPHLRKP